MMLSTVNVTVVLATLAMAVCLSPEDAKYVGCYNLDYASSAKYDNPIKPFSWELCIQLCATKVTRYAGICSSKNLCYCGNDIAKYSAVADHQYCSTCHEDAGKRCGGTGALSLYMIRDFDAGALLLATDDGIKMLTPSRNSSVRELWTLAPIYPLTQSAVSVAYHYGKQELFYISKNKVFRSIFIPTLGQYIPPSTIVHEQNGLIDIAMDWDLNELYWLCTSTGNVSKTNLDGSDHQIELYNGKTLNKIALDPYLRSFMFIYSGKLTLLHIKERTLTRDTLGKYLFKGFTEIAIDFKQELVYVIGSYNDSQHWYLASTDYIGTTFRIIYHGPELSNPVGLDVLDGQVFWGNKKDSLYTIYTGRVSSKCSLENLTAIFNDSLKINSMKIYGLEAQRRSTVSLCRVRLCSHLCTAVSHTVVRCTCPDNMVLDTDERTCLEMSSIRTTELDTEWTSTESSVLYGETSAVSLATFSEDENTNYPTDTTTSSEISTENKHKLANCVRAYETGNQESVIKNPAIATVQFICIFVILGLQIVLLYLYKNLNILTYKHNFNKSTELLEL